MSEKLARVATSPSSDLLRQMVLTRPRPQADIRRCGGCTTTDRYSQAVFLTAPQHVHRLIICGGALGRGPPAISAGGPKKGLNAVIAQEGEDIAHNAGDVAAVGITNSAEDVAAVGIEAIRIGRGVHEDVVEQPASNSGGFGVGKFDGLFIAFPHIRKSPTTKL